MKKLFEDKEHTQFWGTKLYFLKHNFWSAEGYWNYFKKGNFWRFDRFTAFRLIKGEGIEKRGSKFFITKHRIK